ncbi:MAG: GNAT family N-acetyltransferase [Phycisphaerales bacterium]|nr:GNAT family N-acetyltransferase [Phycisphaerales bacterium]
MPWKAPPAPVTLELPHGRARLEPYSHEHAAPLVEALGDGTLFRWMPVPPPTTLELMRAFMGKALDAQARGEEIAFTIFDRTSGLAVGSTRYLDIRHADMGLEIGWTWLSQAAQRTSINTECKRLLLGHAFETLGAIRVQLKTDARNAKSRAAIGRIGARFEGMLRCQRVLFDGHVRDTAYYSIIAEEWGFVRERLESMLISRQPGALVQ